MERNGPQPHLKLRIVSNFNAGIIDKSGNAPLALYAYVQRLAVAGRESDSLTFLTTGSVFDLGAGFAQGLIELEDQTSGEKVKVRDHEANTSEPKLSDLDLNEQALVTLPPDSRSHRRAVQVPFRGAALLRDVVEPGHEYKLRIRGPDLGIKWWGWGVRSPVHSPLFTPPSLLPAGEPSPLHQKAPSNDARLRPVPRLALPPRLAIALSLAITPGGPTVVVRARNPGPRAVTLKTSGEQRYLLPPFPMPGHEGPVQRARVLADAAPGSASPSNFVVTETTDLAAADAHAPADRKADTPDAARAGTEDAIGPGRGRGDGSGSSSSGSAPELFPEHWVCTLKAPGYKPKYPRRQFTSLGPDNTETITRLVRLPERAFRQEPGPDLQSATKQKREFRITLRPAGCWWIEGTMDDVFGKGNEVLDHLPTGAWQTLPLMLESEDELVLRVEYGEKMV
ncbi:hypothetical protein F5Y19DRAFT_366001 [Xylariaceae sp. FL1651]|nr:hypothetical protein F5Y19DRAFT_366001 [Xylariaceae sp. FL1651]